MAILQTRCPTCRLKFGSPKGFKVGRVIHCPKCDADFTVQDPDVPAAPTHGAGTTVATARPAKPSAPAKPTPPRPAPPAKPISLDETGAMPLPAPAPAQKVVPLSLDDDSPPASPRRSRFAIKAFFLAVALLALGGGGFIAYDRMQQRRHPKDTAVEKPPIVTPPDDTPPEPEPEPEPEPLPAYDGPFPRRLLFIHIANYQFLNPLMSAAPGAPDRIEESAYEFAKRWKIPTDRDNDQVFLLSDTSTSPPLRPLVKDVVRGTFERFFDTCRPQDHIVLYLGGHALEVGGKAYFAPVEGEIDEPASLIPVDEIYAKLKACKATQKVVVWDVCRLNPQRGRLRPGSDPMTATLAKLLSTAPPDVEVMTTCSPGENAMEFFTSPGGSGATYSGSMFLEAFKLAGDQMLKSRRNPQPTDAIPVAKWAPVITKHAAELAKVSPGGSAQTVAVAGKPKSNRVPFVAAEALAKRFDLPESPKKPPPGALAGETDAIVREFSVPPLKLMGVDSPTAEFINRDDALKEYKADVSLDEIMKNKEKYRFRVTVLDTFDAMRAFWRVSGKGSFRLRESFPAPVSDAVKRAVQKEQDGLALGIASLEAINDRLDAQLKERALQPKRWQAHYDYARALVKSRLAYLNEYNKMLGDLRTETLLALDPKQKEDSYRLVSTETARMKSKKEIKQYATEAAELYEQIIAERRGTPWADQVKREKLIPLGMTWQPYASKP